MWNDLCKIQKLFCDNNAIFIIIVFIRLVTYSSIFINLTDWAVELIVAKISKRIRLTIIRSEKFRTWKKNVMNATKMITNDCA